MLLIAGWCGCVAPGDQRVDITAPQANIALRRTDADTPDPVADLDESEESHRYAVVRVFYGTDRARGAGPEDVDEFYSGQSGRLELGVCEVSIPDNDESDENERPRIWRIELHEGSDSQPMLLGIEPLDNSAFVRGLRRDMNESKAGEAFVFVHGCGVDFVEATRQTARIAHDLQFDGPPILYSWPSQGELAACLMDRTTLLQSQPHLINFLQSVSRESGATKVHLIAHGTGTQLVAGVLEQMSDRLRPDDPPRFHEVVLAAPDIDAENFRQKIASRITRVADRVTVYTSADDPELLLSAQLHGSHRLGQGGAELVMIPDVPGIDVVDVSSQNFQFLDPRTPHHENELLTDIRQVFDGAATTQRGLQPHPARQPAWRLPTTSDVKLASHSEQREETKDGDLEQEGAQPVAKEGLWTRLTGWWPW